jgi:carboxypeptidase Taq
MGAATLQELRRLLAEIADLERAQAVLEWDTEVWMPPRGENSRAVQLATLEAVIHERWRSDRIGELLDEAAPHVESLPEDSDDACLVRFTRRKWERKRKVPPALAAELAKVQVEAYQAWVKARDEDDFPSFRPWLERAIELTQRWIECFAPYDDLYDVALDENEEGMSTEQVRAIFDALRPELTALVAAHEAAGEDELPPGPYPIAAQDALSRELIHRFGASWDAFRLDETVHPFEISFGLGDVRLTTRYGEDDLMSLFTAMHECGHGLYEYGVSPTLDRTPLCGGVSAAVHESQSRLWENVVGRSLPFLRWFYPRLQNAFPDRLGDVSLERFHRIVNRSKRSYIRVDADETSYGLHVMLRFELERELLSGRLAVKDLPEAWNTRFHELLGLEVPSDRLGVLQDSHWAGISFGYFPTYLLGSVLSVQIWEKAREAIPDLDEQIERGDFSELHGWLRENLYSLGSKFTPAETIRRVVGGPIDPEPYLRYLRGKLSALAAA